MKLADKKPISKKQEQVLSALKFGKLRRINILEGSVRSGKTYVSLILWGFWISNKPKDSVFLMVGKTLGTLKRNVLQPLQDFFGDYNFSFSITKKEALLFGRKIYLESACDSRAESKIRGMTLDGAYCDELTLFEEDFFTPVKMQTSGNELLAPIYDGAPHAPYLLAQNSFVTSYAHQDIGTSEIMIFRAYIGSINNLDVPILKTSAQTMKITYEIYQE